MRYSLYKDYSSKFINDLFSVMEHYYDPDNWHDKDYIFISSITIFQDLVDNPKQIRLLNKLMLLFVKGKLPVSMTLFKELVFQHFQNNLPDQE